MEATLRRSRHGACTARRLRDPSEHHEVGVEPDALDPAYAEEREAEVVL
jgi:hypothetical protein